MFTDNLIQQTTTVGSPAGEFNIAKYRDTGSPASSVGSLSPSTCTRSLLISLPLSSSPSSSSSSSSSSSLSLSSSYSLSGICLPPRPAAINHPSKPGRSNVVFNVATKPKPKKQYQCPECLKIFSRPSALQTHSYTHTAEKPFKCSSPNCGRSFSVVSNLRRHFKVHQKQSNKNKLSLEDRLRCVRQLMERSDAILSGRQPSNMALDKLKPLSPALTDRQPLLYTHYQQQQQQQQRTPSPSPPPLQQPPPPQQQQQQCTGYWSYSTTTVLPTPCLQQTQQKQLAPFLLPAIEPTQIDKDLPSLFAFQTTTPSSNEGLFLNSMLKLPFSGPNMNMNLNTHITNNNSNNNNNNSHDQYTHSAGVLTPYSDSSVLISVGKSDPSYFDYNLYC